MRHRLAILLLILLAQPLAAQTTQPSLGTKTIDIKIPTEVWPGWQSGLIDEDPHPTTRPAEQYTSFPTPAGAKPTFSGRVVGLDSYEGAEISVIPVYPREYISNNAYQSTTLSRDGTFSLTSSTLPQLPKTVCVRVPGYPWTFVRHDFPPDQSGRDIVLRVEKGKELTVSAQLRDGPEKTWMTVEAFDGYQQYGNDGKPAQSRYYGGHQSEDGTAKIMLPLRPMAIRVRAEGSAMGYVIVDPREVDHLVVRLPSEARINGRVVAGGRPMPGKVVWLFNPCARLTWGGIETGTNGSFSLFGLMPGEYCFIIDGRQFVSVLRQGQTTDVVFDIEAQQ